MTANGFHQTVRRVWHVTVIAEAPAGALGMVSVLGFDVFVTLRASGIRFRLARKLVVGIALMHGMTTQATHGALLKTRGFDQAIILAPGYADHAIGPISIGEELRVALAGRLGRARYRRELFQIVARPILKSFILPIRPCRNAFDAVALAANLGRRDVR